MSGQYPYSGGGYGYPQQYGYGQSQPPQGGYPQQQPQQQGYYPPQQQQGHGQQQPAYGNQAPPAQGGYPSQSAGYYGGQQQGYGAQPATNQYAPNQYPQQSGQYNNQGYSNQQGYSNPGQSSLSSSGYSSTQPGGGYSSYNSYSSYSSYSSGGTGGASDPAPPQQAPSSGYQASGGLSSSGYSQTPAYSNQQGYGYSSGGYDSRPPAYNPSYNRAQAPIATPAEVNTPPFQPNRNLSHTSPAPIVPQNYRDSPPPAYSSDPAPNPNGPGSTTSTYTYTKTTTYTSSTVPVDDPSQPLPPSGPSSRLSDSRPAQPLPPSYSEPAPLAGPGTSSYSYSKTSYSSSTLPASTPTQPAAPSVPSRLSDSRPSQPESQRPTISTPPQPERPMQPEQPRRPSVSTPPISAPGSQPAPPPAYSDPASNPTGPGTSSYSYSKTTYSSSTVPASSPSQPAGPSVPSSRLSDPRPTQPQQPERPKISTPPPVYQPEKTAEPEKPRRPSVNAPPPERPTQPAPSQKDSGAPLAVPTNPAGPRRLSESGTRPILNNPTTPAQPPAAVPASRPTQPSTPPVEPARPSVSPSQPTQPSQPLPQAQDPEPKRPGSGERPTLRNSSAAQPLDPAEPKRPGSSERPTLRNSAAASKLPKVNIPAAAAVAAGGSGSSGDIVSPESIPESPRTPGRLLRADSTDAEEKRRMAKRQKSDLHRQRTHRILTAADPDKALKESFQALDKDGNGVLSVEEAAAGLLNLGIEIPHDLVARLAVNAGATKRDRNNEPLMEFAHFKQFVNYLVPLKQSFEKYDLDHSSSINRAELASLLSEMKWNIDKTTVEQIVQMVHKKNPSSTATTATGQEDDLDFEEFATLVIYIQDMAANFATQDKSKNNTLGGPELQALLRALGFCLSVTEVELHLKRIRASGPINFPTLLSLMQSIRINGAAVKAEASMRRQETRRQLVSNPSLSPVASRRSLTPSSRTLTRKTTTLKIAEATAKNREAQRIIDSLRATPGKKWEDPDFPATAQSLYPQSPSSAAPIKSWRRISEISPKAQLFIDGVDEGDVMQGALGDCWFISALSVLTNASGDLVQHLFVTSHPEYGFYQVTFFKDGEWQVISVDDRIPCGASGAPYFASCRDKNEFWVPILEKAYAKLHGCYAAIESGNVCDGLVDLTGESSEAVDICATEEFWKTLLASQKEGYLMGCSSAHTNRGMEEESPLGILQNHAYGVMEVKEIRGQRLIRVRNPWGSHEWKGRWSDNAKEWTPELIRDCNAIFGDDGSFFMCFEDFCEQFNRLYVLRLLSDDIGTRWQKQVVPGEWTAATAGGCLNHTTWNTNPQFKLHTTLQRPTRVFVSLRQPDIRLKWTPGAKYPPLGVMIMRDTQQEDYRKLKQASEEIVSMTSFLPGRETALEFTAQPGVKYVLIPCTFVPQVLSKFFMTVLSMDKVVLSPLTREPPMAVVTGSWSRAAKTAGGCPNFSSWRENPQFLLKVSAPKSRVTISLEQPNPGRDGAVAAGFYVLKSDPGSTRKKLELKDEVNKPTYVNSAQIAMDLDLPQGQYNILPSTFDKGVETNFVLRAIGPADVTLTPTTDNWKELTFSGNWGPGRDGGCKNTPAWTKNPKYNFKVSKAATVYIFVSVPVDNKRPSAGYYLSRGNTEVGRSAFSNGSSIGQAWKLESGLEYTIMPCTFDAGISAPFTVTFYSDVDIALV